MINKKEEKEIAKEVLYSFREAQSRMVGNGCLCDKCIECMRIALKKNQLIKMKIIKQGNRL